VLKLATGEFIFFHDVDNFLNPEALEVLRKNLFYNKDVDLVYADSIVVREYGKNFNEMKGCYTELLENSKKEFSANNMIKSLPGPFCMWRRKVYERVGPFREDYKYAMDWEMWLRMVKHGSKFKKVNNFISGVYYYNSEGGMSTAQKYEKERKREEAEIFFDYYHVFREEGEKYIDYFWSFIA
jgi:cellulose synthase/poly-beta-1,6-N-acetylglucosamine synthase-like glycosyltransferase